MSSVPKSPVSPADKVIKAFGGVRATARVLGRNASSVSRWRKPVSEGGTGGRVPGGLLSDVLAAAREQGLALSADDLIKQFAA
jgi:transposase-like protein